MKKLTFYFLILLIYSCSNESDNILIDPTVNEYQWVIPTGTVTGSYNLFPLAQNPTFSKVNEVNFISDEALVAMISFNNEIRVYPYQYISTYESVNDIIDGKTISMTYCPITKSALCWNTNFKGENFVIRASGYLLNDNVVLYDEQSDTYWSQMLTSCVKGKYAEEENETFNFIETTWGTVKDHFNDALVFTNTSVNNATSSANKIALKDFEDGESVYGILNKRVNTSSEIHIFKYNEFENEIKIYQPRINAGKLIVIGSKEHHFMTSYINDNNSIYTPIQGSFPIVMEDNHGNQWDVFGMAISGPNKGHHLESPVGFVALGWAWKDFYSDFVFNE